MAAEPDDSVDIVRRKEALWTQLNRDDSTWSRWKLAGHLWCARWFTRENAASAAELRASIDALLRADATLPAGRLSARLHTRRNNLRPRIGSFTGHSSSPTRSSTQTTTARRRRLRRGHRQSAMGDAARRSQRLGRIRAAGPVHSRLWPISVVRARTREPVSAVRRTRARPHAHRRARGVRAAMGSRVRRRRRGLANAPARSLSSDAGGARQRSRDLSRASRPQVSRVDRESGRPHRRAAADRRRDIGERTRAPLRCRRQARGSDAHLAGARRDRGRPLAAMARHPPAA